MTITELRRKPELVSLAADWKQLGRYERGDRLVRLKREYSDRELAEVLGCSEKTIRNYRLFGATSQPERGWIAQLGGKEILKGMRAGQQEKRRWATLTTGANRAPMEKKLAIIISNWAQQEMDECYRVSFLREVLEVPAATQVDFKRWGPKIISEVQIDGDWEKIIADTRPAEDDPRRNDLPFGYFRKWLASWLPRCMPRGEIVKAALEQARDILRQELRGRPEAVWWG